MKIKRLVELSLLSAAAVILHIVEAQMPPLFPIMGAKLGLSNVMTLVCLELFGAAGTACLLFVRITLTTAFSGAVTSMIMGACGALLCFTAMCAAKYAFKIKNTVWISVIGAAGHNLGQMAAASILLKSAALWDIFR